jgi:hypothetical protein
MAMNASSLGNTLYGRLKGEMPGLSERPDNELTGLNAMCKAIAEEVINHIKANAMVTSSNIVVNGGASGLAPYVGPVIAATGVLSDGKIL